MMKITLQRFAHDEVTFGKLHIEGMEHPDIYTIELPWKDNKQKISCIPQGLYNCTPYSSQKYKDVWEVLSVPKRTAILIHAGNYASEVSIGNIIHKPDTEGCILVGFGIDESIPMVTNSRKCMDYLRKVIGKQNFSLEVKD